ncbi:MAG: phosphate signaling complex protein PhoU, partial [Dehalococcoidia bacterium]|nr:phosphate signaling complex protein PhoU [Dehalococcoidia bacterium]
MQARAGFDRELQRLQDEVLVMGSMVENSIYRALDSLKHRDMEVARRVVEEDDDIDRKRFEIEDRCIDLIATQQPMAGDLRILVTMLHVIVELERMGDYAEGIAKISLMMGNDAPLKPLIDIPRMADKATHMLRCSLDALVKRDTAIANQVCDDDDEVDALYDQV